MREAEHARPAPAALLLRTIGFLGLWLVLIGTAPLDIAMGSAASVAAVWTSTLLWPADARLSVSGLLRFLPRYLLQSVVAGLDIARRAFAPVPPLKPGYASCRPALPGGIAHGALCAVMSTQPGKLPVATAADGTVHLHCLDMDQPLARELAEDEAAFLSLLPRERGDG